MVSRVCRGMVTMVAKAFRLDGPMAQINVAVSKLVPWCEMIKTKNGYTLLSCCNAGGCLGGCVFFNLWNPRHLWKNGVRPVWPFWMPMLVWSFGGPKRDRWIFFSSNKNTKGSVIFLQQKPWMRDAITWGWQVSIGGLDDLCFGRLGLETRVPTASPRQKPHHQVTRFFVLLGVRGWFSFRFLLAPFSTQSPQVRLSQTSRCFFDPPRVLDDFSQERWNHGGRLVRNV